MNKELLTITTPASSVRNSASTIGPLTDRGKSDSSNKSTVSGQSQRKKFAVSVRGQRTQHNRRPNKLIRRPTIWNRLKCDKLSRVYATAVFIVLATTISVLIVCLTPSKGQTCQFNFERSAKKLTEYDSFPHDIKAGDFNEDGQQDIVVANSGADNIGIFLSYRNGTFAPQMTFSTGVGSRPYSVAVGDVNNDTHLDMVVAHYSSNSIGTYLGYGNGSFAQAIVTSLGSSRPLSLVLGYLNHDRVLDIAVVNYGTATTTVLLGANDGTFRSLNTYNMGFDSNPCALTLGDFDGDNITDIVAVNYGTSELVILLNNGMENFTMNKSFIGHNYYPSSVITGHFNNDTRLDIAIAYSGNSSIGIFLGDGNQSFINHMTFPLDAGSLPQSIDVGDFNKDTKLDLAVLDSGNNNVLILKGDGNGNFSITTRNPTGSHSDPSSLVIDYFDNDHQLDIAIANNGTNNVLILTSYLTYLVPHSTNYTTGNYSRPQSLSLADFDHNNYLDIVVANADTNVVGVFLNLGNGTFTNQQTYNMSEGSLPEFVIAGNFNNDQHVDIVVALTNNNSLGILLGDGNGSFVFSNRLPTENSNPLVLAIGDFDNDTNLDIVTVNYLPVSLGVFFGFGNGSFTTMLQFTDDNLNANYVDLGDMNNDNMLDMIIANGAGVGNMAIYLGYGNRSFHDPMFISTNGDIPNTLAIGDLNNDDHLDIVYIGSTYDRISILLGNGDGTFGNVIKYTSIRDCYLFVALGYYNNDSFLDMTVTNNGSFSVNIYLGLGNGSFEKTASLSTVPGSYPYFIMFGDFNNDHQQDIVVTNDDTDNIEIFLFSYVTDFRNGTTYTTGSGSHPIAVSVGDLNNDGRLDVVAANPGDDDIKMLFDYNGNTFINTSIFSTGLGSHPQSVTIADFNRDSFLDVAVVNSWENSMNVYLGLGDGSFAPSKVYSTSSASNSNSIVAGDFNNDGRMDVVIANEGTDNVAIFLAFDYISFTSYRVDVPCTYPTPYSVVTGDFNNDHKLDMAVLNKNDNTVGVYLGYGNGTFSDQITSSTGSSSSPQSLATADFNGDNYLDIVVAYYGSSNVGVFLGNGNGSFQTEVSLYALSTEDSSEPYSVATGDFDNDHHMDFVVANFLTKDIWIFWGNGSGFFTSQIIYPTDNSSSPVWVTVGDLNDDAILDVIFTNRDYNDICILYGYGNRSFGHVTKLSTGLDSQPGAVTLGDFNGDKSIDIAVANQNSENIILFFGDGTGSFPSQKNYSVGSNAFLHSITACDINNDTFLDILVADYNTFNSSFAIFYGFGDGNFTLPKIYPSGLNSDLYTIAPGDFNNDGKLDLATGIGVFIQHGNEPFGPSALLSTGNQSKPKSVAIGDFNNDHHLDIVVANSASNNLGILLGYGNGQFAYQLTYSTGNKSLPSSIAVGQFNNDGYLDIAVVNTGSNNIGIFFGYGDGRFRKMTTYSNNVIYNPVAIATSDLNEDSYLDLIVANSGTNDILVFFGQAAGLFSESTAYSVGYNARPQSIAIGDVNNDNKLDIVVANYGTNYIEILLQTC